MRRSATSPTWRTCSPTAATASRLTPASSRIPVWKPLDPNLKVYIEFSNETWNSGFVQAETRSDGWANQLSQRALYDYLTNNQDDPLYPGGGNNAYNDGAILASYYSVNSSNDSTFLARTTPTPHLPRTAVPRCTSAIPPPSMVTSSVRAGIGLRDVQISNAFKAAFGETDVNAVATNSRVRPVFEWQYGGNWAGALGLINDVYGAQHPGQLLPVRAAAAAGTPTTLSAASVTSVSPTPLSPTVSPAGRPAARRGWSPTDPLWATPTPRLCSPRSPSLRGHRVGQHGDDHHHGAAHFSRWPICECLRRHHRRL